jgi:hypothetical protein
MNEPLPPGEDAQTDQARRFMERVAEQIHSDAPLPNADIVLARARLLDRQRTEERALRPMSLSWRFTKYWLLAAGAFCCVRFWPHVSAFADGFGAGLVNSIGSLMSAPTAAGWAPILLVAFAYSAWRIARDVATRPKS